jgi:calpain
MLNDSLAPDAFQCLIKAYSRGHLMGCAIDATSEEVEEKMDNGLVKGHAYSVTGVGRLEHNGEPVCLIRVRNPWGNEREWTGAWGDNSPEWEEVSEEQKASIGLNYEDDGEFWMDFEDFKREFSRVTICHKEGGEGDTKFNIAAYDESWVKDISAGGCRNFIDTFASNPQFRITLEDTDDDDDDSCTLIVSVMQKNFRGLGTGNNPLTIGFMVYPVDAKGDKLEKLDMRYFKTHKSSSKSLSFVNAREVVNRVNLPPGKYCIVPSTFQANEEGEFHLRILSEGVNNTSDQIKDPLKSDAMAGVTDYDPNNAAAVAEFRTLFLKTAGTDGVVSATEIQGLIAMCLEEGEEQPAMDHVNALMALFDADNSGKLDYHEFLSCWRFSKKCRKIFKDVSNENKVGATGLREALSKLGISIPLKVLQVAVQRYGDDEGSVSSCDFTAITCKIQSVLQICQEDPTGVPAAVLEKLINAALKM